MKMTVKMCFAAALACSACTCSAAAKTFWMKPGATGGDGSRAAPFGSFDDAKRAVRTAVADASLPPGAVEVVLMDGEYFLAKPVEFSKDDSGSAAHPVVWRAENRGCARITGGVPVPQFFRLSETDPNYSRIPASARANVMVADLKAAGIRDYGKVRARGYGSLFMELVWGGRLQTLARWPNDGYTGIADMERTGKKENGDKIPATWFVASDDRVYSWADEPEPYGNGFFCYTWAADRVAFDKIDPVTRKITQKGIGSHYGYSKGGFWFGFNLLCELDSPGEYYIDRGTGRLYFWPENGGGREDSALTVAPALVKALDVSRFRIEGLLFEKCRSCAVGFSGAEDVQVIACTFRNIGGQALHVAKATRVRVAGCDVAWCGSGGIAVSGGDPAKLEKSGSTIENCHVHHFALSDLTFMPAMRVGGCGVSARGNTIHDGPHSAVMFSGRENEVSWNEIHSVLLECGEMGVIYGGRDWTLCGLRMDANYIHDIYNPRSQYNRGIMLDDGAAGITVTSNRFERLPIGVSLSGIGNVVENNLFISNYPPVRACQKWQFHSDYTNTRYTHAIMLAKLAKVPVREEPWKSRYPYLAMIDDAIKTGKMRDPATRTVIRRNYSPTPFPMLKNFSDSPCADFVWHALKIWEYSPDCWVEEDNKVGGEPPAGFAPLPPISAIGVQNIPERATWPISHPVTIKCRSFRLGGK